MLHSEPSFSVYADEDGLLDDSKEDLRFKNGSGEFSFAKTAGLIVEKDEPMSFNGGGDDYKRKVDEEPSNPLFLKNYAHLLQLNGDLNGAEEYYFRATIADPKNGEILMRYAKLVWELHHDQDRALSYFECAARAAPQDHEVLAAYASFLWEIDEDDNDEAIGLVEESLEVPNLATGLGVDVEKYHRRMVIENPKDPLLLRNYANFLQQTKGDLEGAEKYYSRAVEADPGDGKVISDYAQLVWERHHDQQKAFGYFERAIEADPADSRVLAAYAKFLWEANDEEDELQKPVLEGAVPSTQV